MPARLLQSFDLTAVVQSHLEMEFTELRAVINYLRIKGLPRKAVHEELVATLIEEPPFI